MFQKPKKINFNFRKILEILWFGSTLFPSITFNLNMVFMLSKIIQNLSVGNKPIMGLKIFKKGPKPKSIYHRIFLMFNLNSLNN